jgi:hypothetical protein
LVQAMGGFGFPWVVLFSAVGVIACGGAQMTEDADAGGACGFSPCGGELLGAWRANGACPLGDPVSLAQAAVSEPACRDLIRSATVGASGTAEFLGDGTVRSDLALLVDWTLWLSDACAAALSSQPGLTTSSAFCSQYSQQIPKLPGTPFSSGECTFADAGCACQAHSIYAGRSPPTYAVQGTEFLDAKGKHYPFCAAGSALTMQVPDDSFGFGFVVTLTRQ